MRAWLIDSFDGIDTLRLADVPDPTPEQGQVVLRVQYAALNPADYYLAQGQYPAKPPLPHILGRDGIGVVEQVGPGVTGLREGDECLVLRGEAGVERPGTFAEKVAIAADRLAPRPQGWRLQEASCASLVYLTAWQALNQFGPLEEGATVLVTGASGGVGTAAIQLAHASGYRTVALSRSQAKQARLRELGADVTVDPTGPDLGKRIRQALDGGRVDLVVDNIGGEPFNEILGTLGMNGRISCVGRLAGPVPDFNTASLFFRRVHIRGVAVGTYTSAEARQTWDRIVATLARTEARPEIDRTFPFEALPEAFGHLQQGPMGKVLLRVCE